MIANVRVCNLLICKIGSSPTAIFAPADQYALIGESANLNCSVTLSSAQIYWFSFEDPSVNGSSSVSIGAVGVGDDHPFICSVVLYMSTVLRTVYLHVLGKLWVRVRVCC